MGMSQRIRPSGPAGRRNGAAPREGPVGKPRLVNMLARGLPSEVEIASLWNFALRSEELIG